MNIYNYYYKKNNLKSFFYSKLKNKLKFFFPFKLKKQFFLMKKFKEDKEIIDFRDNYILSFYNNLKILNNFKLIYDKK